MMHFLFCSDFIVLLVESNSIKSDNERAYYRNHIKLDGWNIKFSLGDGKRWTGIPLVKANSILYESESRKEKISMKERNFTSDLHSLLFCEMKSSLLLLTYAFKF